MIRGFGAAVASRLPPPVYFVLSAAGLSWSVVDPLAPGDKTICGSADWLSLIGALGTVAGAPAFYGLLASWLAMLVAMMAPLAVGPIAYVRASSLQKRRAKATGLFAAAYIAVWTAAGLVIIPLATALRSFQIDGALSATLFTLAIAWSCSPTARRAHNACHRTSRIGACGEKADRECLVYGWRVGVACVGFCWPFMLAALAATEFHVVAMAAIAIHLYLERIAPAGPLKWRLPLEFATSGVRMRLRMFREGRRSILPPRASR